MARRRNKRRGKRRGTSRGRKAAAKKAAATRKRNKSKRRAAGKKGARTRRRNAGRRRRSNPRRRNVRRRNPSRRRKNARRRNPSRRNTSIVRSTTTSLRSLTKMRTWQTNLMDGAALGAGYAGVNAVRAIEGRFGIDSMMAALPPGIARTVGEYALKIVNIGITTAIAGIVVKGKTKANVQKGGLTNLGVQFLGDISQMFGGTGEIVRGYLGDYNLAYNMGQSLSPRLGNYNLIGGGQVMASTSGLDVYAPPTAVY